jgi:hypothetical protein
MTSDQKESRDERVAIMVIEGMSEDAAHTYCDSKPDMYGHRDL